LPRDETTPPVMKMYFVVMVPLFCRWSSAGVWWRHDPRPCRGGPSSRLLVVPSMPAPAP
jgi:hypothetical protein